MFSFQGASQSPFKRLNEISVFTAISVNLLKVVEISGIEPLTSCLQGRRSPSWAKPPDLSRFFVWWAKMDSLFCGKATPVTTCHRHVVKSRLSSHQAFKKWWAKMDSNHRPHDYQSCALASWAIGPYLRLHIFLGTSFAVPSKLNNASSQNTLYWP